MVRISFCVICDRSIFSPIYDEEGYSKTMLPSVGRIWDFFKDECLQEDITLYTTGEVWEKISPKLKGACEWVEGLFCVDNTTLSSATKFKERFNKRISKYIDRIPKH